MSSQVATSERTPVQLRYGAKALLSTSDRVLVVRERHADGTPFWTLPGGGREDDESLRETLQRELVEELRCRVVVQRPVTSFWYAHSTSGHDLSRYTVFDCQRVSPETPNLVEGVLECRWVRPDEVPASTLPQVRRILDAVW